MREIKFRAWDDKKWRYDFAIYEGDVYAVLENCPDTNDVMLSEERTSHWKVVQFTGLKDKNGREVFEGDLLRNTYGDDHCPKCHYSTPDKRVYVVIWRDNRACFDAISGKDEDPDQNWLDPDCWHEYAEVIGNIYENPELLKAD